MSRKNVERGKISLKNLCYDNRVQILDFIPTIDDILCRITFRIVPPESIEYVNSSFIEWEFGFPHVHVLQLGRGANVIDVRKLIRTFYGYFQSDTMRRIYFFNFWRTEIVIFVDVPNVEKMEIPSIRINFKDIQPYRSKWLFASIDCSKLFKNNITKNLIKCDLSGVDYISSVRISTYDFPSNSIFKDFSQLKRNLDKMEVLYDSSNTGGQKYTLSVQDYYEYMRRCKGLGLDEFDFSFGNLNKRMMSTIKPICRDFTIKFPPQKPIFFPDSFFYPLSNLRKIHFYSISFIDSRDRNNFFEKLNQYTPVLYCLNIYSVILTERILEAEESLISVLNKWKRLAIITVPYNKDNIKFGDSSYNMDINESKKIEFLFLSVQNLFLSVQNNPQSIYKLNCSFFRTFFHYYPFLFKLGLIKLGMDQPQFIDELDSIIRELPKTVSHLYLIFPYHDCSSSIISELRQKKDQLTELNVSFRNMDGKCIDVILSIEFSKLEILEFGFLNIFIPFLLKRKHAEMISRGLMKNLKLLEFCFDGCETLVYFIKYSEHTQHIQSVLTRKKPSNYPPNPFYFEDDNGKRRNVYLSDILLFREFHRGSNFFEDSRDEFLCYRNMVRRRKEQIIRHSQKDKNEEDSCSLELSCLKLRRTVQKVIDSHFMDEEMNLNTKKEKYFVSSIHKLQNQQTDDFFTVNSDLPQNEDEWFRIRSSFSSLFENEKGVKYKCYLRHEKYVEITGSLRATLSGITSIFFMGVKVFSRNVEKGVVRYDFASPDFLEYVRFCLSQEMISEETEEEQFEKFVLEKNWISVENVIRLICGLVGVEFQEEENSCLFGTFTTIHEFLENEGFLDMKWILRESQRIYGVEFEELKGDNVDFLDCLFVS